MTRQQELMLLADMEDEYSMYQVLWSGAALDRASRRSELAQREPVLTPQADGRVRADRQGQIVVAGQEIIMLR